jgi:hypothetical protein
MRPDLLHVIAVVSNPIQYRSRYDLYRRFADHMRQSGVRLWTVELAFGARPWVVTGAGDPQAVQVRSSDELWHKENLINIGAAHLPEDWEYAAWIDADVAFQHPHWAAATVDALQHYDVVQPWSHALDLDPGHQVLGAASPKTGFCYGYVEKLPHGGAYDGGYWHPGYAWAIRRRAFDAVGGLLDRCVIGNADHHMAAGLIGEVDATLHPGVTAGYRAMCHSWQALALTHIRRNIGYVPGLITHHWHGRKTDRKYLERWSVVVENAFDPETDLRRDLRQHGLLQLTNHNTRLRDDLRRYFRQRNEDSIDVG